MGSSSGLPGGRYPPSWSELTGLFSAGATPDGATTATTIRSGGKAFRVEGPTWLEGVLTDITALRSRRYRDH
jgi:hypothetical protein